jgi:hypothetical protein
LWGNSQLSLFDEKNVKWNVEDEEATGVVVSP